MLRQGPSYCISRAGDRQRTFNRLVFGIELSLIEMDFGAVLELPVKKVQVVLKQVVVLRTIHQLS
jgi:hypothetical protein